MLVIRKVSVGLCMLWVLAAGASAATTKPSPSSQGNATIYFPRPMPVLGWANKPDIKLDGRIVGELSPGSYFTVSSPRGQHKIEVQGGLDGGYESELQVDPGKSYFIEIGPKAQDAPGTQLLTRVLAGNTWGRPMPGRGFMGAYVFYLLEAEEGRTKIAKLKKISQ
jgi:Protein of unknown function (DUF2846)